MCIWWCMYTFTLPILLRLKGDAMTKTPPLLFLKDYTLGLFMQKRLTVPQAAPGCVGLAWLFPGL